MNFTFFMQVVISASLSRLLLLAILQLGFQLSILT